MDGLALKPQLPKAWRALSFSVQWRGRTLKITVRQGEPVVEAVVHSGEPMTLEFKGTSHELRRDAPLFISSNRAEAV